MDMPKHEDLPKDYPSPRHFIIDTDVGGDDAQALIVAFYLARKLSKKIVGIVCVEGNTTLENVVKNVHICKKLIIDQYP